MIDNLIAGQVIRLYQNQWQSETIFRR